MTAFPPMLLLLKTVKRASVDLFLTFSSCQACYLSSHSFSKVISVALELRYLLFSVIKRISMHSDSLQSSFLSVFCHLIAQQPNLFPCYFLIWIYLNKFLTDGLSFYGILLKLFYYYYFLSTTLHFPPIYYVILSFS